VQNDFTPRGALAVKEGDKIIPPINKYIKIFSKNNLPVFATRDWHPRATNHFKKYGGLWPVHCVQGTKGAEFHPKLKLPKEAILLYKGMDPNINSYSAFHAQDKKGTYFMQLLRKLNIQELYISGLATDYCVKFSALHALKKGFKVKILTDAIKGVNLKPQDSQEALRLITRLGAEPVTLEKLIIK
jgi:nicotinamidase/pyrazinamidase